MSDRSVFRVGAIGAVLEVQFITAAGAGDDVSSATVKRIRIMLKGATAAKQFTAAFSGTGTDGKIRYVTASASDLDAEGTWLIQGYLEMPGWQGYGPIGEFEVGEVLGPVA